MFPTKPLDTINDLHYNTIIPRIGRCGGAIILYKKEILFIYLDAFIFLQKFVQDRSVVPAHHVRSIYLGHDLHPRLDLVEDSSE